MAEGTLWSFASGQSTRDIVDFTYDMYVKSVTKRTGKWKLTLSMKNMEIGQRGTNIATTATTRETGSRRWAKESAFSALKSEFKKAEENAIKKLKDGINILSVEKQGSNKQNRYGSNSSNTQVAPKPNHRAMAKRKKGNRGKRAKGC
eukprot:3578600-Ditylum_brightwellii.AAC.1